MEAMMEAGHLVRVGGRNPLALQRRFAECDAVAMDLLDPKPQAFAGTDVVINAVGALSDDAEAMRRLHLEAPWAWMQSAQQEGVRRFIQISATGAMSDSPLPFLRSKGALEERVAQHDFRLGEMEILMARPDIVLGAGGASSGMFLGLSTLPIHPSLPPTPIAPVDVRDLAAAIGKLVEATNPPQQVDITGPSEMSLNALLQILRSAMGKGEARILPIPPILRSMGLSYLRRIQGAPIIDDSWPMLTQAHGATAPTQWRGQRTAAQSAGWMLGDEFARNGARRWPWIGVARLTLALTWLAGGAASLINWPTSMAILADAHITGSIAQALIIAGAGWDLLLGSAVALGWRRRLTTRAQVATLLGYSVILTTLQPQWWLHPFGPLVKNLPMLLLIVLLPLCSQERGHVE
ncbi:putative NADH dehydrogenase [Magnetofaba australis IT-1]|uniref:Putative NADH dehydrogenase n=1 Tax=Magnetofaba australis IT-1 TaxID=1434232 RepID=A0A1Y2K9V9_9PROT|nr:putative NADH dehydrogenase [Magnetofaba australis IT-1]